MRGQPRATVECATCGRKFLRQHNRFPKGGKHYCSRPCLYESQRGSKGPNWRGGRIRAAGGYVAATAPRGHPRARGRAGHGDGYVLEHRLVMESMIGRYLEPHETVHHINGDKTDNRPENLELRSGRHGKGVVHRCRDCGSTNIEAMHLA